MAEGDAVDSRPQPVGALVRECRVALAACVLLVAIIRRPECARFGFGDRRAHPPHPVRGRQGGSPRVRGVFRPAAGGGDDVAGPLAGPVVRG